MRFFVSLVSTLGLFCSTHAHAPKPADRAARWEKEIAAIEKRQQDKAPVKEGIVFAGSSSVRLWDLARSFPDWNAINCGFGGSDVRDSTTFAKRIIVPHAPRAIVFYAGDNDIANGRSPQQVVEDYKAFCSEIHRELPKTEIYFIAIKPSVSRWKQYETQSKANALVRELSATDKRLHYIDVVKPMLGADGQPPADLFVKDGLHLSPKGYEIWAKEVKAAVK